MTGKQLFDEMNQLGDDLIKEAINTLPLEENTDRSRTIWIKRLAAVACIVLFLSCVTLYCIGNKASAPLPGNNPITASDILSQSKGLVASGTGTKAYFTMVAGELSDLMYSPIKNNTEVSALKVYQSVQVEHPETFFKDKVNKIITNVKENFDTLLSQENDDQAHQFDYYYYNVDLVSEKYKINVETMDAHGVTETTYRIWNPTPPIQQLELFGDKITITPDESDESIENKLTPVLDFANKVFGTNCEFQYITRDLGYYDEGDMTIKVEAFENSDNMNQSMYNRYLGSIRFLFMDNGNTAELTLIGIYYTEYELQDAFSEDTRLLSVKEAEYYLEHGYIFAGHVCSVCMSRNAEVDFSDYDDVEIVYRRDIFGKYVIPFYAFYKTTGEHMFAVAYVPAVEVDGLKEYFVSQEAWHNNEQKVE